MDGRFKPIGTSVTLTVRLVSWLGVGLDGKFSQVDRCWCGGSNVNGSVIGTWLSGNI